ncbi:hypothetical protein NSB03_08270 [Bacteroides acidifaciens]|nr:hypothetical protein [Bacteroides acidifaciens]MCR1997900.1 hypothetical protein [Bacteroides acidifaciens]
MAQSEKSGSPFTAKPYAFSCGWRNRRAISVAPKHRQAVIDRPHAMAVKRERCNVLFTRSGRCAP